jgi:hypothetical protein
VEVPDEVMAERNDKGVTKIPDIIRSLIADVGRFKFKTGSCSSIVSDDHTMLTGVVVEWADYLAGNTVSHNPLDSTPTIYGKPSQKKSAHKCRCEMVTLMSTGCKCGGD